MLTPLQAKLIQYIGRCGLVVGDHIADRFFRDNAEDLLSARTQANAALQRLVMKGYLEQRPVSLDLAEADGTADVASAAAKAIYKKGFTVTQRATLDFNLPVPPTLRDNFVDHHVRTMDALFQVETRYRLQGYEILQAAFESELIREKFRGKVFDGRSDAIIPKFADAVLTVRAPDGHVEHINVEYVTSHYTNGMIREKADAFSGRTTVWAAANPATAARIERLTGAPALLL